MKAIERRKFQRRADRDEFQRRVDRAAKWVRKASDRFDRPCIHLSGGKDSLVLLHLVTQRCGYDDAPVYHFDNGVLAVPGSTSFVQARVDELGGRLFERSSEAANDERMVLEEGHGYAGYWGCYKNLVEERGWDCRLLGIRAAESPQRRDRYGTEGFPVDGSGIFTSVAPIHRFSTRDVWAYIVDRDLEYHELYDEQGALFDGIDHPRNRLVTLYDREFDSLGSLELSQWLYPGTTNTLKEIDR